MLNMPHIKTFNGTLSLACNLPLFQFRLLWWPDIKSH